MAAMEGKDAIYQLASHVLLSQLSYRTKNQPTRDGTTDNRLGPPPINR